MKSGLAALINSKKDNTFFHLSFWAIYNIDTLCYTAIELLAEKVMQQHCFIYLLVQEGGCSMAGWEEELAVLLRELGVTQEEPKTHLRPTPISETGHSPVKPPLQPMDEVKRQVQSADALFWGSADDNKAENDDIWMSDLRVMRREVESIVTQVVRLMQRGDFDPSLKEDVMVVLRALRRRASVTQQAAASDAAYLEFAAAMLHFCRIILRLSEGAPEDF